ncbi:MAG: hypothetical protein KA297_00970 [Kofleriaceae bacterium]|nr:hypothetical protein [Kofleriaceae bacterium]MBP6838423.1 hypothetical protein [Kofleriaceae bacterium]
MKAWIAPSAALALALAPLTAHAQGANRQQDAANLVSKAIARQNAGAIEEAAALYREAYCLLPEPVLVYNIGTAYKDGNRAADALPYFRLFLKLAPNAPEATDARNAVAQLAASSPPTTTGPEVAELRCEAAEPTTCADGSTPVDGTCAPAACPTGSTRQGDACVADGPAAGAAAGDGGGTLRWAGIGTAVAGVVLLAVGSKYGLDAYNLSNDVDDFQGYAMANGGWSDENRATYNALIDDGEAAERKQIIFSSIGGVAIAAGAVMYVLSMPDRKEAPKASAWRLTPSAGPNHGGLALTGGF